jgi:hypothetical protein
MKAYTGNLIGNESFIQLLPPPFGISRASLPHISAPPLSVLDVDDGGFGRPAHSPPYTYSISALILMVKSRGHQLSYHFRRRVTESPRPRFLDHNGEHKGLLQLIPNKLRINIHIFWMQVIVRFKSVQQIMLTNIRAEGLRVSSDGSYTFISGKLLSPNLFQLTPS